METLVVQHHSTDQHMHLHKNAAPSPNPLHTKHDVNRKSTRIEPHQS
jgi:hypothetical protein